jgi:hypothetical protein
MGRDDRHRAPRSPAAFGPPGQTMSRGQSSDATSGSRFRLTRRSVVEPSQNVVRTHCLVRTPPHVLLAQAALHHREQRCSVDSTTAWAWSSRLRPSAVVWRSQALGSGAVAWCLEAEPAANGTIAHLSAVVVNRASPPRRALARTVLAAWTRRELMTLARVSETLHGPYQRLPQHGGPDGSPRRDQEPHDHDSLDRERHDQGRLDQGRLDQGRLDHEPHDQGGEDR